MHVEAIREMKYILEEEYDYDFQLIGISCHAKDYRLSWAINYQLGFRLEKQEKDLEILSDNPFEGSAHSLYAYYEEEDHHEYYLIGNRDGSGYLIPEQRQADFVIMIKSSLPVDLDDIIARLRKIDLVLTAFSIDVEKLKSKKNLIF